MIMINDHDGNGDDATYSEIAYQSSLSRSLAYEPNEQVNVVHTKDYSHHNHAKNNNKTTSEMSVAPWEWNALDDLSISCLMNFTLNLRHVCP